MSEGIQRGGCGEARKACVEERWLLSFVRECWLLSVSSLFCVCARACECVSLEGLLCELVVCCACVFSTVCVSE